MVEVEEDAAANEVDSSGNSVLSEMTGGEAPMVMVSEADAITGDEGHDDGRTLCRGRLLREDDENATSSSAIPAVSVSVSSSAPTSLAFPLLGALVTKGSSTSSSSSVSSTPMSVPKTVFLKNTNSLQLTHIQAHNATKGAKEGV